MDMNKLTKAQMELASIREYCEQNSHMTYDEMESVIESRVYELQNYCSENNIPLVINLYSIVSEFCAEDSYEESSYYEEEYYSSYYEEEEYEEEEPEYSSCYEDPQDSSY